MRKSLAIAILALLNCFAIASMFPSAHALTVPSPPRNLKAVASPGQIALSWDVPLSNGGSPITSYYVYRGSTPGKYDIAQTDYNFTTEVDGTVISGQTYYYAVSAISDAGKSGLSNEASATALSAPPSFSLPILSLVAGGLLTTASLAAVVFFLVLRRRDKHSPS